MKRYKIRWENGGYRIGEEKPLTKEEKEFRENNSAYCANGKPKKSEMVCMQKWYRNSIGVIHGHQCAGNQCYFYAHGCDQHGCEWN